jgi:hypothetical protein
MRYMLLIYVDEVASAARSAAEVEAAMALHAPYIERLRRNGQYAGSEALAAARSARTLRSAGGKPVATEGPFAESREQLGGFYLVEAADLDDAIAAAAHCPALTTIGVAIEIRPVATIDAAEAPLPRRAEPASHGRYLLAIYRDETAETPDDEPGQAALMKWRSCRRRLSAAGQLAGGEPFAPSGSATALRLRDGKVVLTDGPFAEGREQLAGYCIVWARDMDEAVGMASECREGWHAVEVRPIRGAGG